MRPHDRLCGRQAERKSLLTTSGSAPPRVQAVLAPQPDFMKLSALNCAAPRLDICARNLDGETDRFMPQGPEPDRKVAKRSNINQEGLPHRAIRRPSVVAPPKLGGNPTHGKIVTNRVAPCRPTPWGAS